MFIGLSAVFYDLNFTDSGEKIENIPPRFAINYRNKFMLEAADIVVTYVKHSWGGAAKYKRLAEKKNRRIIEISI